MLWLLVLVPAAAGLLAFAVPWNRPRRGLLLAAATVHGGLVAANLARPAAASADGWIALDPIASLFLAVTSFIFLVAAFYTVGYLAREGRRARPRRTRSFRSSTSPRRRSPAAACCFWRR